MVMFRGSILLKKAIKGCGICKINWIWIFDKVIEKYHVSGI